MLRTSALSVYSADRLFLQATILASALSQPKSLFRIASRYIHKDPDELNSIVSNVLSGVSRLDAGTYSEPLMHLRAFIKYESCRSTSQRQSMINRSGLHHARFKHFIISTNELLRRCVFLVRPTLQLHILHC